MSCSGDHGDRAYTPNPGVAVDRMSTPRPARALRHPFQVVVAVAAVVAVVVVVVVMVLSALLL